MASWKKSTFLGKSSYIFPTDPAETTQFNHIETMDGGLELDEADVHWNDSNTQNPNQQLLAGTEWETKKSMASSRSSFRKPTKKANPMAPSASSLPVNIPDWSKILKEDYKEHRRESTDHEHVEDIDDHGGETGDGTRIPPHEYLATTRGTSFSVHEGIGRTLKGRDLRRVRNAIWKRVGFED